MEPFGFRALHPRRERRGFPRPSIKGGMDRYIALQVFRQVAERNSFAAAGRRLGLSPAAISKNVAELEAHLGTRLFQRTTRRVSLTGEGALARRVVPKKAVRGVAKPRKA